LEAGVDRGAFTPEQAAVIRRFLANPAEWHSQETRRGVTP
jgi:hypothetical protein